MRLAVPLSLFLAFFVLVACSDPVSPDGDGYTQDEIAYFAEVALGAEFGSASARVRRWTDDVRIHAAGTLTAQDRTALDDIVADLDALTETIAVRLVDDADEANVTLHVVPQDRFRELEPNYVSGNMGFFWVNWRANLAIYRANVLVSSEDLTADERAHLLREELTQCLGLMRDSDRYPDSIFYTRWTATTDYAPIDRALVEMLYREEVEPGMDGEEVEDVLRGLERVG